MVSMFSLRSHAAASVRGSATATLRRTARAPLLATALACCVAFNAHAALIVSGSTTGALSGLTYETFDRLPLGKPLNPLGLGAFTLALNGTAEAVQGSRSGLYAAPYVSALNGQPFGNAMGRDATTYLSTGNASISFLFANPQSFFGLLWGSVDSYNSLEFYNGSNSVGRLTGRDVIASPNGDQGVNGSLYVNVNSSLAFDKVVARSTSYAFEFDNLSYGAQRNTLQPNVPAPQSGLLLGLGLVATAALAHRSLRRKSRRRLFD